MQECCEIQHNYHAMVGTPITGWYTSQPTKWT